MERSNSHPFQQQQQQQQQQHTQQTSQARYPAPHNTSSAFSASANPNEDWTKISDLAERRRIQNRIAQRNYRKKLKRRLEDLERKASSTSPSPEPARAELVDSSTENQCASNSNSTPMARQNSQASLGSSVASQDYQLSPELYPLEDPFASMTMHEQQMQFLTPPSYSYQPNNTGSDYFSQDFTYTTSNQIPQIYTDPPFHPDFSLSLAPTLPSMNQLEPFKQGPYSMDDDFLNPFGITYATLAGMDGTSQHVPAEFQARSPPSSDGWSSDHSRENSPPYFTQPMTPVSRSTSPNIKLFEQYWQL